jgi:hypothetical protein
VSTWKDVLAQGATRIPSPVRVNPYDVLDTFGAPTYRNDYVEGAGDNVLGAGDYISGSGDWLGRGRTYFGTSGSDPNSAGLAAALATQQGKLAAAQRRAAAGLASLEAFAQNPGAGPSIGGNPIDSPSALPFLAALGLGPQKTQEEEERDRLKASFGASLMG